MATASNYRHVTFAPMPADSHWEDTLCSTCKCIDFGRYRYKKISAVINLGKWGDIVRSQPCPFCRLVVRSLAGNPNAATRSLTDQIVLTNHPSWSLGVEQSPYDRLKSESYSNKFDLRSMSKRCERLAYRLVVFSMGKPEERAYIQYLAPVEKHKDDRQFFGRCLDRDQVDFELLRSRLSRCKRFHEYTCEDDGIAGDGLPRNLRLIDVERRLLIRAPAKSTLKYVTLSYVWGAEQMEKMSGIKPVVTKRVDVRMTQTGEEVTPLPAWLPRTIEDAIALTRELGFSYLWVDALCIIQDDPDELKKVHLERMDAVYNCSKLTIVAASGQHADSGLPGMSIPRRYAQLSEHVDTYNMAAMSPSFSELENSKALIWNTRGWTFQEKIFAKRLLVFTDYQVYYGCSESIWTEEVIMETETPSKSIEARPAKYRWTADRDPHIPSKKLLLVKMVVPQLNVSDEWNYLGKFPDYAAVIREYSQRKLTDRSDTLIAISGILKTLRADAGDFICGLPESHFLQSLLWHPEPGSLHTIATTKLPTFTWASWNLENGVIFDVLDVRMLRIIMVTIRNVLVGTKKALSRLASSRSSSSDSSSSSTDSIDYSSGSSSSSSPSYGSGSGSGSGPSGIPFAPPLVPYGKREWTTLNAIGKATVNVAFCFGFPLFFRHHTTKHVFFYDNGRARELDCEEPLTYSTFTKGEESIQEDTDSDDSSRGRDSNKAKPRAKLKSRDRHSRRAADYLRPVLAFKTVIVRLSIGACLRQPPPRDDDEASVFELLGFGGRCVGEVWTTLIHAHRGRDHALEFATISWGLSLTAAELDQEWIPRWTFDAKVLPESKTKMLMTSCKVLEELMSWNSGKHLAAGYGLRGRSRSLSDIVEEQPSAMSFFDALLTAKKGEPRPKFLWSTVNVLLIERDKGGQVFRRVGVGRVIFEAWLVKWSRPEEIILG